MAVYEAAAAADSLDRCVADVAVLVLMGVACGRLGLRELAVPEGWDVGGIYYWSGSAFQEQGKVVLAVDLLEKALSYRETTRGKTHSSTLDTAHYLADAPRKKGELDRALELYEEGATTMEPEVGAVTGTGRLLWQRVFGRRNLAS